MDEMTQKSPAKSRFSSIRFTMISAYAALIISAMLIFLLISLSFTRQAILNDTTSYTAQLIGQVNSDIESYISYLDNISYIAAGNTDIYDYFFTSAKTPEEEAQRKSAVLSSFQTIMDTRGDITNIGVITAGGKYLINHGDAQINPATNAYLLDWYRQTMENRTNLTSSHVQNLIEGRYDWVITLSRRLSSDRGRGIFFVDMNYDSIRSLCENIDLGTKGYVFILDKNGDIVYHPQQQLLYSGLKTERIGEIMNTEDDHLETPDDYLYSICRSEKTGWTIVGVAYIPEVTSSLSRATTMYITIAIALVLIALIVAVLISNRITRPISQLEDSMKEVEQGNFDMEPIPVLENDEIGHLTNNYNIMTARIHELMEASVREQSEKREAELRILQNQINPHFLYNTLDSIIWMAEWGRNKEVVQMTSSLSKLMRQSISNGKELVSIAEEASYTESYLTIQKMRYKDKLEYVVDIDEDIRNIPIIKLILQPLVENAIYHGIKVKEEKGHIWVSGYKLGDKICLQVEDDGVGMDEQTLTHIFEKHVRDSKSNGVGLKNVQDRIQLYYGPEYGITFESEPGKGTTALITLPGNQEVKA